MNLHHLFQKENMIKVQVDEGLLSKLKSNTKTFKKKLLTASNKAVRASSQILFDEVRKNISRRDYSLSELQGRGNPYARKHGRIMSGKLGTPFTTKPYLVHTRKGGMLRDLKRKLHRSKGEAEVFFINSSGHTDFVINGTQVMMPRDVIGETSNLKRVRKSMLKVSRQEFIDMVNKYGK